MNKKQKRLLQRVLISAAVFLLFMIVEKREMLPAVSRTVWTALYLIPYLFAGYDVLRRALRNICNGQIFDENFLMSIATAAAFGIGEYSEACAVMIFYQIGELFQSYAVGKSRASITEMMSIAPDYVNLEEDGVLREAEPDEVEPGSVIVVRPGERIPLDGEVLSGESLLDTAALTGESVPRSVGPGDAVISGCTNGAGVLRVRTTKCYEDSTVARILELVETAGERKAHLESFITRFARWYTPVVTLGAVLLALFPPLLLQASFAEWIHRACIFLIVSCPCALVISVPLGFFGGIGAASRLGVLVKGANFLEAAAELDTLVFDKTGTLTEGTFRLSGIYPAAASGYTEAELLRLAAIVESRSTHPIAQSICAAYRDVQSRLAAVQETESLEAAAGAALPAPEELQEIAGMGISARCDGRELLLGSAQLMEKRGIRFQRRTEIGTAVYLACDGQFIGGIVIADAVKPGAEEAISALRKLGVRRCVMLSGDRRESAEAAAAKLGMDEVYSELLPEDKVQRVEALLRGGMASEGATEQEIAVSGQKPGQRRGTAEKERQSHGRLGFVGDGINDAPVLMRADVGIAMGSLGSDAAIEAADIVIMDDDIGKLAGIIRISRRTLRIVRQNVFFALLVKAAVLFFGALGMANMWEAVFGDVGVTVLAVLNSMRALKVER